MPHGPASDAPNDDFGGMAINAKLNKFKLNLINFFLY